MKLKELVELMDEYARKWRQYENCSALSKVFETAKSQSFLQETYSIAREINGSEIPLGEVFDAFHKFCNNNGFKVQIKNVILKSKVYNGSGGGGIYNDRKDSIILDLYNQSNKVCSICLLNRAFTECNVPFNKPETEETLKNKKISFYDMYAKNESLIIVFNKFPELKYYLCAAFMANNAKEKETPLIQKLIKINAEKAEVESKLADINEEKQEANNYL